MKWYFSILVFALAMPVSARATEHHAGAQCGDPARPLLSVADFDGNGRVEYRDLWILLAAKRTGTYYAFFDRNADHVLDRGDMVLAFRDLGKASTAFDRELAQAFKDFGHFQHVDSPGELALLGFLPGTQSLRGHGVHWLNQSGAAATQGAIPADRRRADGLNVPLRADGVWGMFWGSRAQPLFADPTAASGLSTLDYPTPGGVWETKRVQAFETMPPRFFSSEHENWHPHAGLCAVIEDHGAGLQYVVHQHLSFAECQALPSLGKTGIGSYNNAWSNFWMLHLWMFELNPDGPFAGVHACLDPDAPPEHMINGDREIPPFFQMH